MNDMKERLIDLNFINYINTLLNYFNKKYLSNLKIKFNQIIMYMHLLNHNIIYNLKELNIFNFKTLSDFTVVNFPGYRKEFELHYFLISYKLSIKNSLNFFINKEDLVVSLMSIFDNSN
jgi:NADH:ubiquinone oxidoreductase subunit C